MTKSLYAFQEPDLYDCILKCIEDVRELMISKLKEYGLSAAKSRAYDNDFGDCRHHRGIDLTVMDKKFYIGFAGLNIDTGSGNIHSSIGRVQLYVGTGYPNVKHMVDGMIWYDIRYPKRGEKSIREIVEKREPIEVLKKRKIVAFNTGYCIMGNHKCGDILLKPDDKRRVDELCELIVEFIKTYGLKLNN